MIFNDRRQKKATARAIKAAQGPSLAPKGYKTDTAARKSITESVEKNANVPLGNRKQRFEKATKRYDSYNW